MGYTVRDRAMAEQERYLIQSRTNDGVQVAMNFGSFVFRPVYGYYLAKERVSGANVNVAKVDPDRAKAVRTVIDATIARDSFEGIAATLNERGVRTSMRWEWSSSSVQNVLSHAEMYAGLPFTFGRKVRGERLESLCIGQPWDGDVRVVLFVRLRDGLVLDRVLVERIRATVREHGTPRHVPAVVLQVPDVPRTKSGEIVELAVRAVVMGEGVRNLEALANPEALEHYRDRPELGC